MIPAAAGTVAYREAARRLEAKFSGDERSRVAGAAVRISDRDARLVR
jgi:hypothetical protein